MQDNGVGRFVTHSFVVDDVVSDQTDIAEVVDQYDAAPDLLVGLRVPVLRQPAAELFFPDREGVGEPLRVYHGLDLGVMLNAC